MRKRRAFSFARPRFYLASRLQPVPIRVSAEQLPEIHATVTRLAAGFGMPTPETYVIDGGGALNAFATRFAGRDIVILFSDLLDACDGSESARDMIIAHELGHLHRGATCDGDSLLLRR